MEDGLLTFNEMKTVEGTTQLQDLPCSEEGSMDNRT